MRGAGEPSPAVEPSPGAAPTVEPRRSGRAWLVAGGVLLVLLLVAVVWVGLAAVRVMQARDRVVEARDLIDRRLDGVDVAGALDLAGDPDLRRARALLAEADSTLGGVLLAPARMLPILGTQVHSAAALAGAGVEVLDLTERTLVEADQVVGSFRAGTADQVQLLGEAERLATAYESGLAAVDLGPSSGLLPELAEAHDAFARRRADLQDGAADVAAVSGALSSFLAGPGDYLVLGANNAEMRGGSGMFLTTAMLQVRDGRFGISDVRSVSDVAPPATPVPLEEDLQARWGWLDPNTSWTSLGLSPRFDVTADTAARLWEAAYGQQVDGVIALDPRMIAAIMQAFDITVTDDGRTYTSADIADELLHDQYLSLTEDVYADWETYGEAQAQRRDRLARIVATVLAGVDFGGRDPIAVFEALRPAAQQRHLLLWSRDEQVQDGWAVAGVNGALAEDSMLLSLINRSGNKADVFVDVAAEVELEPGPDATEVAVTVTLHNRIPNGEPRYVAGPNPRTDNVYGDYEGILTLNVPGVSQRGRVDGDEDLVVAGSDGPTRVVGSWVALSQGETETRVFRFEVPNGGLEEIVVEPSGRVPRVRWRAEGRQINPEPTATIRLP